jgi:hypothetical protein
MEAQDSRDEMCNRVKTENLSSHIAYFPLFMAQTFDILQSLTEHGNFVSHLIAESKCILKSGSMLSHASQFAESLDSRSGDVASMYVLSVWKSSDQTKLYTRYRIKSK